MSYPLFVRRLLARTGVARYLQTVRRRLGNGEQFLRHFSDMVLSAPLDDLEPAAHCLGARDPEVIDLSEGSPRFDLLPTAGTKLPADRRGWPPFGGLPELQAAVAEKLTRDNELTFDPAKEIFITAGALGAINAAFDAFVNPGARAVLFDPTSPLYALAVRARRGRVRWLASWVEDGQTRFDFAQLAALLRGARLLVLNSPANPTGGVLVPDDLEQIAWWADRHDVLILSDEVFERYHYDLPPVSIGSLPLSQRRTLTVGSVSKGYALASARVGWLAAPRPLMLPCLAAAMLREPFVPTLCQQQALAALRSGDELFGPILEGFESRRRYAVDRLRALDLNVSWPAGAFFLWLPVWPRGESGRQFAQRLLDEQQVQVTPGDLFGPSGAGYVRLSYATDEGRLQEGLNRLGVFQCEGTNRPSARSKWAA